MSNQEEVAHYLQAPLPEEDIVGITGNTSRELKEIPVKWLSIFRKKGTGFAGGISGRLKVCDVSVVPGPDDPLKMEAKVTTEIDVTPDMCNERGTLSEGLVVFLIDECSTLAMVVISAHNDHYNPPGVSQTINIFHHFQAVVGTKLQIVNRSLESGRDSNSGKTEIWDKENHRLIASGTQITMPPSLAHKWMSD